VLQFVEVCCSKLTIQNDCKADFPEIRLIRCCVCQSVEVCYSVLREDPIQRCSSFCILSSIVILEYMINLLVRSQSHQSNFCKVKSFHLCSAWSRKLSATHYNTLQLTATHCNTLQHTATHTLRHTFENLYTYIQIIENNRFNSLQHNATHCNSLQLTATHIREFLQVMEREESMASIKFLKSQMYPSLI